jgi:hypothetical protein
LLESSSPDGFLSCAPVAGARMRVAGGGGGASEFDCGRSILARLKGGVPRLCAAGVPARGSGECWNPRGVSGDRVGKAGKAVLAAVAADLAGFEDLGDVLAEEGRDPTFEGG